MEVTKDDEELAKRLRASSKVGGNPENAVFWKLSDESISKKEKQSTVQMLLIGKIKRKTEK